MKDFLNKKHKWLITGGAGFIGSHLVHFLLARGQSVSVFDNLSSGNINNISDCLANIELIKGDICDFKAVRKACNGAEYVLHHASLVSVPESMAKPVETVQINVGGTANVLQAAKEAGVRRLIFASSSAVYGNSPNMPYREDAALDCQSPYALTKQMGTELCQEYTRLFGLETVILRYFNVFGPRQNPHSPYSAVIAKFLDFAYCGQPLSIDWDGLQSRDFIYAGDIVQANMLAAFKGVPGEIYNVASGRTFSLIEVADVLEKICGRKLKRVFRPKRAGDIKLSSACIDKISALGFKPSITLEQGLRNMWNECH